MQTSGGHKKAAARPRLLPPLPTFAAPFARRIPTATLTPARCRVTIRLSQRAIFPYALPAFSGQKTASVTKVENNRLDLPEFQFLNPLPGNKEDIISLLQFALIQTERFSRKPLCAVAHNCVSNSLAYAEAEPRDFRSVRAENENKGRTHDPTPARINTMKIAGLAEFLRTREGEFSHDYTVRRFLPLRLLRFNMSRPQRVLILFLNPWVRFRLTFDG